MKIKEKTLKTLEFDKIRNMLASLAPTAGAAQAAQELEPYDNIDFVLRAQKRTTDARRLADAKGMPSFGSVKDVSEACERAAKGAMLNTRELLEIARLLRSTRTLHEYATENKPFDTTLELECRTRDGLLLDVATTMTTTRVRVKELNGKDLPDGRSVFTVRFEVRDVAELDSIRNKLLAIPDVISSRRGQN